MYKPFLHPFAKCLIIRNIGNKKVKIIGPSLVFQFNCTGYLKLCSQFCSLYVYLLFNLFVNIKCHSCLIQYNIVNHTFIYVPNSVEI